MRNSDRKEYALKQVKITTLTQREKENALNEVRILASLQSPFLIEYKQAFFDEPTGCLCIIMEFADDQDVYQKIVESQGKKVYLKEKMIWRTVVQIMRGLSILHRHRILHRDMKSANCFLFKTG